MNTLLCVDDDRDILNALRVLFRNEDYQVLFAEDGATALEFFNSHDIGVVLSDYHMPMMDGLELLGRIKDTYPNTVRILLTGETQQDLPIHAINRGAVFKFSRKPWDREELILMIREAFKFYNLTSENDRLSRELHSANEILTETNKLLRNRLEEKAEEITQLAFYDDTTGLPNRTFLKEWLTQTINQTDHTWSTIGVLMIGIDRFKKINESLGHASGDQLLKKIAARISRYSRTADALCRISGDMFCIVINGYESTQNTPEIALRLLKEIAKPLVVNSNNLYLTASIGLCIYPEDGDSADLLLGNAETAMNYSKEQGGNTFNCFKEEFNQRSRRRLSLEAELHLAIRRNEFVLHYQPRVSSTGLNIVGAEALLRWQHPQRGLIMPCEFIPVLEETGLIKTVGAWVITDVCRTINHWRDCGFGALKISANLSPSQISNDDLLDQIRQLASDRVYAPSMKSLELEITENILVHDIDRAISVLDMLHDTGISLAIDDFGTGYSSMSYLIRLPLDIIKIDLSFIRQLGVNPDADTVVRTIITLAQNLKLKTVAEGVETKPQSKILQILGCNEFQGFLYGKPIPEDQFLSLLKKDNISTTADIHQINPSVVKISAVK